MIGLAGETYAFGPFALTLPEGWTADTEDGIHEILPDQGDYALHLSGYEKDARVTAEDLAELALDHGGDGAPFAAGSGLIGLTFDTESAGDRLRYWLIGHGQAMLLVTLTAPAQAFEPSLMRAELVVRSLRAAETLE